MSPTIFALPAHEFAGDFQAFYLAGPSTATGRPRRVMVIGPPLCSISSSNARHLALNSVALTTRVFIVLITMITTLLDGNLRQRPIQRA
jgi:hypothetical protein